MEERVNILAFIKNSEIQSQFNDQGSNSYYQGSTMRLILKQRIENYIGNTANDLRMNQSIHKSTEKRNCFTTVQQSNLLFFSKMGLNDEFINYQFKLKENIKNLPKSIGEVESFEFDNVYDEKYRIDRIYNENLKRNIESTINGKNLAVILLGPKNSGKTYLLKGLKSEQGLIERTIEDLLLHQNIARNNNQELNIGISIYKVGNEKIIDLLSNQPVEKNIRFNENIIQDISTETIKTTDDCLSLLRFASNSCELTKNFRNDPFYEIISFKLFENSTTLAQIDFVEISLTDNNNIMNDNNLLDLKEILISILNSRVIKKNSLLSHSLENSLKIDSNIVVLSCFRSNDSNYPPNQTLEFSKEIYLHKNKFKCGKNLLPSYQRYMNYTEKDNEIRSPQKETLNLSCVKDKSQKIRDIEGKIDELESKSCDLSRTEAFLKGDQSKIEFFNNKKFITDNDRFRHEFSNLQYDNSLYIEEIRKLSEINKQLENENHIFKNKNISLLGEKEELKERLIEIERQNNEYRLELAKQVAINSEKEENLMIKYQNTMRLKELEVNFKDISEEKNKLEVEFKVLQERFLETKTNYESVSNELSKLKIQQSEDFASFDSKLSLISRNLDKYQRENQILLTQNEKLKKDLSFTETQKETYYEKYIKKKEKNSYLLVKISEIENEMNKLFLLKKNEDEELLKLNQEKERKYNQKQKLINDLSKSIHSFKNEYLIKRVTEKNNKF